MTAKSKELYQKVLTLNLDGQTGSYYDEDYRATIPYKEAAEFALAQSSAFSNKPDPAPLRAFIEKHPTSRFIENAYSYLGYYYGQTAAKEDADKFFEDYMAKFPENKDAVRSFIRRIIKDKDPLDKGVALAEKLEALGGYPLNPGDRQNMAQLYALKDNPAKVEEVYGKDFIDEYEVNSYYALIGYANFWVDQEKNLESAEAAADLALKIRPDDWYSYAQVANTYAKVDKTDKALAVFGPEFAKKFNGEQAALSNYATFWSNAGTNLDSALAAARRSVELTPDFYNNFVLGQVLFKMKNYDEALKAAEKAVELLKPVAAKNPNYPTQRFENLVKQIKEAMAKK
ncbi:MAG: tetratricopeptide repeat protein [Candidatus Aminicenantales bacterium]